MKIPPNSSDYQELSKRELIEVCTTQTDIILAQRQRETDLAFTKGAVTAELQDIMATNLNKKSYGIGLPSWAEQRLKTVLASLEEEAPNG